MIQQPILMINKLVIILLGLMGLILACKPKPAIIEADTENTVQDPVSEPVSSPQDLHQVEVVDMQNLGKYTYMHVREGARSFCVAIPLNPDIKKGTTYYYRGGLIMANPEKLQFKEKFETVFIVASVSENPLSSNSNWMPEGSDNKATSQNETGEIKEVKIIPAAGVIKLSELIQNSSKYDGKIIKVQGQCVKLNRMIMNKNWLHIQDNTVNPNGQKYDLTITTVEDVQLGDVVLFEGKIAINKDFGAGYKYDIILEEARLK